MKALTFFFAAGFWLTDLPLYAQKNPNATTIESIFAGDFWTKIAIAVVSAALAFISSFILAQLKRHQEPRKQLSYSLTTLGGVVQVDEAISDRIKVLYRDREVKDLHQVRCKLENTGNTVIKSQYVRFEFPTEAAILDCYFEPQPPREFGVRELTEEGIGINERRFILSHLERDSAVAVRFVVMGPGSVQPKLHPFNESGDVEFVPRELAIEANDLEILTYFVRLWLLFLIVPPLLYAIPSELGSLGAGLARLVLVIGMFPRLRIVSKSIAKILSRWANAPSTYGTQVQIGSLSTETFNVQAESSKGS
jgi:hypothetical protein